jgi:hypothetical protein
MADLRLPYVQAKASNLLPDFALIRADLNAAVYSLNEELLENNPHLANPYDPRDLTAAQVSINAAYEIQNVCPPWEWLSHLFASIPHSVPKILWAARQIDLGETRECLDRVTRGYLLDPDTLIASFLADPMRAGREIKAKMSAHTWREKMRIRNDLRSAECIHCNDWWASDIGQLDFNRRVLDFAQQNLDQLIADWPAAAGDQR